MKNRLHSFIFTLSLIALSLNVQAYVITTNSVGQNLSWSGGSASPTFYANWTNSSGLSYYIFTTFTNALSRWKNLNK